MATSSSLEDIVRAIAQSIMQAQHMVEKEQVSNFATFFTDDREPTTIDICLPATHSTAKPDDKVHYRLPLLALVPHSSLVIGEAEVDLDLELGDFEEVDRDSDSDNDAILNQTGKAAPAQKKAMLMVSASGAKSANRSLAHIKLKLQAAEKTEGLARLLDDVIKCQGMTGLINPSAKEPGP
ncbi:DUF2589 domain-containing protein [Paraburkholderia rhizosphaerae]|uniref:Uncharacterized protein DUF2589 n=1 Tax=Paraburkholderia rhizosphaerae TaxID=480658 RepID=A0A4R8LGD9_9BURK|nr:DUF2589 domain-containing protein [Paraburkholderia rhizosphaerae]TDY42206.1 uncharacterized protein DUF2589 [Paraburkholderia rhizosphaerae]